MAIELLRGIQAGIRHMPYKNTNEYLEGGRKPSQNLSNPIKMDVNPLRVAFGFPMGRKRNEIDASPRTFTIDGTRALADFLGESEIVVVAARNVLINRKSIGWQSAIRGSWMSVTAE